MAQLTPDVEKKYSCAPGFLGGQKLVFPKQAKHGVAHKAAHELTMEEVDKLFEAGAVKGVFTLKTAPAASAKAETPKP